MRRSFEGVLFTKQQIRIPCNRSTTMYQPQQAPPNRARAKGAQHPQGVRRIRKAAKPPTAAQRYSTQKEARNPDTHRLKTSVRRRHTQNAPDQNPKQEQGLSFSTGVFPRGKSKKGARPPFWSPEGVGIPKGRGPCERTFPLGRVFGHFLHAQKATRIRGRAGPEIHQIRASAKASALVSARVRRHERFA